MMRASASNASPSPTSTSHHGAESTTKSDVCCHVHRSPSIAMEGGPLFITQPTSHDGRSGPSPRQITDDDVAVPMRATLTPLNVRISSSAKLTSVFVPPLEDSVGFDKRTKRSVPTHVMLGCGYGKAPAPSCSSRPLASRSRGINVRLRRAGCGGGGSAAELM